MNNPELEPVPDVVECMHIAGQEEIRFCMMAIAELTLMHPYSVPTAELEAVQDKLLDRYNDLDMRQP